MWAHERGNEVREVKIPSCGTVKAGFRTIYTVWMKMMRLCSCTGSQRLEHLGRRSADVFHLEAVIVYNFSHLFWAQSGMFLRCHKKRRWVQRSAAEKMCGFEISLWDRGMSPPPPGPPLCPQRWKTSPGSSVETMRWPRARCKLMTATCFCSLLCSL